MLKGKLELRGSFVITGEARQRLAAKVVGRGKVRFARERLVEIRQCFFAAVEPAERLRAIERSLALGRTNIRLIALGDLPAAFEPCDAFYSKIVLQHNPPPLIGYLLRTLIRSLRRGGVGVFQVPTYYAGYRFDLHSALQSPQHSDMEMHCYPQADLFSLFADEGARLVYVREDDTPGRRDIFVSQVFVLMK